MKAGDPPSRINARIVPLHRKGDPRGSGRRPKYFAVGQESPRVDASVRLRRNSSTQSLIHRISKTMPTLSERQDQTAVQLVRDLHSLTPGRESLLNLTGELLGLARPAFYDRVVEEMHREKRWIPVLVTAPNREYDSGPIALLETAGQLRASELLNGEVAILSDPRRRWADKMAAITEVVDKHRGTW